LYDKLRMNFVFTAILLTLLSSTCFASAQNCLLKRLNQLLAEDQKFTLINGGKAKHLPNGTIVEGSIIKGGIQPHYIIDISNPVFTPYLQFADKVKASPLKFWEKIDVINDVIRTRIFTRTDYDDPKYIKLLAKFRNAKKDIPLSAYVKCGAGVCRENALVAHVLLERAGIPNTHIYATIERKAATGPYYEIVEDHAFVIIKHQGQDWAVDPYYIGFNGYLLKDLMRARGVITKGTKSPIAVDHVEFRRILKINDFPKALVPAP